MTRRKTTRKTLLPRRRGSLRAQLTINVTGKFGEKIQQRPVARLSQHRPSAFRKCVPRMRLPCGRNQPAAERASVQRQLRTQLPLALVVSNKIPQDREPRPRPKPAAPALIVTGFVLQLRISERCQTVGRNELPFAGRKSFRIATPTVIQLLRRASHLINSGGKRPLEIRARCRKRLLQINLPSLFRAQRLQVSTAPDVGPCKPPALPISHANERCRS